MAWFSPFIYVPYYMVAIYAFIFEKEWIRVPSKSTSQCLHCGFAPRPLPVMAKHNCDFGCSFFLLFAHSFDVGVGAVTDNGGSLA